MEFVELLKFLYEVDKDSQSVSNEQIVKFAEIVDQNNKMFDTRLDAMLRSLETISDMQDAMLRSCEIVFILTMIAIAVSCLIVRRECLKKNKRLESRIDELEKNIKKS